MARHSGAMQLIFCHLGTENTGSGVGLVLHCTVVFRSHVLNLVDQQALSRPATATSTPCLRCVDVYIQ